MWGHNHNGEISTHALNIIMPSANLIPRQSGNETRVWTHRPTGVRWSAGRIEAQTGCSSAAPGCSPCPASPACAFSPGLSRCAPVPPARGGGALLVGREGGREGGREKEGRIK